MCTWTCLLPSSALPRRRVGKEPDMMFPAWRDIVVESQEPGWLGMGAGLPEPGEPAREVFVVVPCPLLRVWVGTVDYNKT
jgi:hypothetical protein